MRRRRARSWAVAAVLTLTLLLVGAPAASAHSAFLGSLPEPGTRLGVSPRAVTLTFTESLNSKLTTARVVLVAGGKPVAERRASQGRRLTLRLPATLTRGAYRIDWHSVSGLDGHTLEGSFSLGARAPAAGGEHSVSQSPLARNGWLRILARGLLYGVLLVFAGGLLLRRLVGRERRDGWLVPRVPAQHAGGLDTAAAAARERALHSRAGPLAAGLALVTVVAESADAAGGLSGAGVRDYLLTGVPGIARVAMVALIVLAALASRGRPVLAASAGVLALGAVAVSGHADSASSRVLAVVTDWVHLIAVSLWLGGIALIGLVWGPQSVATPSAARRALMRDVLPVFGRVALPAFVVVVAAGTVNSLIELGDVRALWSTSYGRILAVKITLVATIAAASYLHALRIRPRLLAANPHPDRGLERRHWRLLRAEPLLGAGVVAAVAVLVAFPLPPRELTESDEARAGTRACRPCPLPAPAQDELAVAAWMGPDLVAGWIRRDRGGSSGVLRLLDADGRPAAAHLTIVGARQRSCGTGCQRFTSAVAASKLSVRIGPRTRLTLPARWQRAGNARAHALLIAAYTTMRRLHGVRLVEDVTSGPGSIGTTVFRIEAPNREAQRSRDGTTTIQVGDRQWLRAPGAAWLRLPSAPVRFEMRRALRAQFYLQNERLLAIGRRARRRVARVAYFDIATPAWVTVTIDLSTKRILTEREIVQAHRITHRYSDFNTPAEINPPSAR